EIEHHLEDRYRELRSVGASEEEAYRKTIAELDDLYPLRAGVGRNRRMAKQSALPDIGTTRGNLMEDLWRDLRYAVRTMRKSPVFVLFAVLMLALGIGANTTVFTVINTLILNPLPVRNSGELAAVTRVNAKSTSASGAPAPISYADLKD